MIDWPQQLVEDIARRKAVLFLGAGVSKNSVNSNAASPPDWISFLKQGAKRIHGYRAHVQKLINKGDLLTACEIIKDRLGDEWHTLLTEQFVTPRFNVSRIHKLLFSLDLRFCLTQNFDKIYDTYAQHESGNTVIVKSYDDGDLGGCLRRSQPLIIKAHGTIDHPSRMIFTKSEYAKARQGFPSFYACFDALLLTHTFIFYGCSLADPDMQLLLERYNFMHTDCPPHFIILPKEGYHSDEIAVYRRTFNLRTLKYSKARNHEELISSTEELVARVEPLRNHIAQTREW